MGIKRILALLAGGLALLPFGVAMDLWAQLDMGSYLGAAAWMEVFSWILLIGWGVYCAALYRPGESKLLHLVWLHGFALLSVVLVGVGSLLEHAPWFQPVYYGAQLLLLPVNRCSTELLMAFSPEISLVWIQLTAFCAMLVISLLCCGARWVFSKRC